MHDRVTPSGSRGNVIVHSLETKTSCSSSRRFENDPETICGVACLLRTLERKKQEDKEFKANLG